MYLVPEPSRMERNGSISIGMEWNGSSICVWLEKWKSIVFVWLMELEGIEWFLIFECFFLLCSCAPVLDKLAHLLSLLSLDEEALSWDCIRRPARGWRRGYARGPCWCCVPPLPSQRAAALPSRRAAAPPAPRAAALLHALLSRHAAALLLADHKDRDGPTYSRENRMVPWI